MSAELQLLALARQGRDLRRFLQLSHFIYQGEPHWVAPLFIDQKQVLSNRNPFFRHAEMQLWMASRNGRDLGRIAAIVDHNYNQFHEDQAAFFGYFESVQDPEVSRFLLETVGRWARKRGHKRLLGPMNPNTNHECGLLVQGFDRPPVFMMTYNPPYYEGLLTAAGFAKAKDLIAFDINLSHTPLARLERIASRFRDKYPDITVRPVNRPSLNGDLAKIKEIYNSAWQKNWGFVPMTNEEVDFLAERLKPLLVEGLVWLAETTQEPAGFLLAVPDLHEAIQPLRGRFLSRGLIRFLPYWLGRKTPAGVRVLILGVKASFRNRGIESAMLAEGLKVGAQIGFTTCEASWVLEDNLKMRRVIEVFGGKPYKTYRIYEKTL